MFKLSDGVMKMMREEFDRNTEITDERRKTIRGYADKNLEPQKIAELTSLPVGKIEKEIDNYKHS